MLVPLFKPLYAGMSEEEQMNENDALQMASAPGGEVGIQDKGTMDPSLPKYVIILIHY